jgi:hypothetical protein
LNLAGEKAKHLEKMRRREDAKKEAMADAGYAEPNTRASEQPRGPSAPWGPDGEPVLNRKQRRAAQRGKTLAADAVPARVPAQQTLNTSSNGGTASP